MSDFFQMSHIYRRYQTGGEALTVLRDVNLTVEPGEYLSVLGPSGSGKSTLMNIAGCLDTPTEGEYILNGAHVDEMRTRWRWRAAGKSGLSFSRPSCFRGWTRRRMWSFL